MNDEQLLRYSRQIMLPQWDIAGQETLLASRVLIVGLGGLGCPVAMYLAAAGVGQLVLADFDDVDLSNLQRQIAHGVADIGRAKSVSAQQSLSLINDDIDVIALTDRMEEAQLLEQVSLADVVVDCSDNFSTRHAINRASVATATPLVSGAAIRFEGQVSVFDPRQTEAPCYRCLYAEESDENLTCSESGVIAPLVGIIGSMQALETLKLLAQVGQTLSGKLLMFDGLTSDWRSLTLPRDPACPVCAP
ncbi:molybdopterin-synthase adenylyltransferase MoeB [Aestuariicella hydrocarbonica]|uniref:Molybdopterin-synthase adenylyltransferase MoeB n=1 Tax=Pseudomaricurvus hydrocarbonicus TaxID=1470433 RepID=A0A9E5MLY8_9GAMM|nr:molybdopterin-synthase adenylyltransferase MoeB [Aestuariicella hydrocarbonica]NHO65015.1 molybdopterin-synthase adenylyltransferase MoeB [Aestuariicella hydrocarbonica]